VHSAILNPLSAGDIFVDVGANVGYYTILASKRVGKQGHVIAIEPFPETVEQLKLNIGVNCAYNIEVIESAVWSESNMKLVPKFTKGFWGQVRLEPNVEETNEKIHVPAKCIDDICKVYPFIKVLKIDIEATEYEALKGAKETLAKTQFVITECNQNREQIVCLLKEAGFQIQKLNFCTYILASKPAQF